MEQRGDVDWRQVKEVLTTKYLTVGVGRRRHGAIVVAYFTAGAASGVIGAGASSGGAMAAGAVPGSLAELLANVALSVGIVGPPITPRST
ncbi:hypothetical protein MASR1M42_15200 [Azonexus hydrophilus]